MARRTWHRHEDNIRLVGKYAIMAAGVAGGVACGISIVCGVAVGAAAGFAAYAAMNAGKSSWNWNEAIGDTLWGAGAGKGVAVGVRYVARRYPGKHALLAKHAKGIPQIWQRNLRGQTHKHRQAPWWKRWRR